MSENKELQEGNLSSVWKDGQNVDNGVKLDLVKHLKASNETKTVKKMKRFALSFAQLENFQSPSILDIGCGIGTDVFNFSDELIRLNKNGKIIGVDFNKEVIAGSNYELQQYKESESFKNKQTEISIEFQNMDATALTFEDETFDLVFICCTLQHIKRDDVEKVLSEVKRVMKRGGRGVIVEPDPSRSKFYSSNAQLISLLTSSFAKFHTASNSIGGDLFHLIPKSGLKIVEIDSFSNATCEFQSTDEGWVKLRGLTNLALKMGVVASEVEANDFFDQYVTANTNNDLMCSSIAFVYAVSKE